MPKEFKEKMRKSKIPPKVRGYIYKMENFTMENGK